MMRTMRNKWLAIGMVGALGLGLAACGGDDDDDDAAAGDDAAASDASVVAEGFAFTVAGPVAPDSEFIVENKDGTTHTFTADDGAFSEELPGGETVPVGAPSEPGEYTFHCEIHASMTGTLTVE